MQLKANVWRTDLWANKSVTVNVSGSDTGVLPSGEKQ